MKHDDLLWLAGLLEGEGSFAAGTTPHINLGMTDRDVMERAARLQGCTLLGPYQRSAKHKPMRQTTLAGERAILLMKELRPLMGCRRSKRIDDVLEWASKRPGPARGESQSAAKLRGAWIPLIRELAARGLTHRHIGRLCGVDKTTISYAVSRKTWKHIT